MVTNTIVFFVQLVLDGVSVAAVMLHSSGSHTELDN